VNSSQPAIWSSEVQDTPAGYMHVAGDVLLVPAHEPGSSPRRSTLHALNLTDGSLAWQKTFEDALVSGLAVLETPDVAILVAHSAVDLLRGEGALVALDAHGEMRWRWSGGARSVSAPAIIDDRICVTTDSTVLTLLDLATGAERARINLDASASLAAPLVIEGVACVPCRGPHLLAVGLDGAQRWRYTFPGEPNAWLNKTPVAIGDRLFATASNVGAVVALRARGGSPLWRVDLDPTDKKLSAPATDGRRLYVGARDGVHALDPEDGHAVWHFATGRRVEAMPVAAGGVVYATCHDHQLYALDAATGAELWRHEMQQRIEVPPLVTPDGLHIIIADHGGTLMKIVRPLGAEELEVEGRWAEAAELWRAAGEVGRAIRAFKQAEMWAQAAQLCEAQEWWVEAAEYHEQALNWAEAGRIYRGRIGNLEIAAASFVRAARAAAEQNLVDGAVGFWDEAKECYQQLGDVKKVEKCGREVARLRHLPHIQVRVEAPQVMTLEEYHEIAVELVNDGGGLAKQVLLRHTESEFAGDLKATRQIRTLSVGEAARELLLLRALAPGQRVPLDLIATYTDAAGQLYETRHRELLAVRRPGSGIVPPSESIPMEHPTHDTAAIRDLLTAAFSDEELTTLCFDRFRTVYDNFSSGMSKGQKIQLLLDYGTRHDQVDRLLSLVQGLNPAQYARFEPRLRRTEADRQREEIALEPRATIETSSVSGGVDIQSERTDIGGDVTGRDKIQSAGGHIIHAEAGATVIVGGEPRTPSAESAAGRDEASLSRQLAEAETNLKLIQERKSQYVLEVDIPLQLIKEERSLLERIAELKRQMGE